MLGKPKSMIKRTFLFYIIFLFGILYIDIDAQSIKRDSLTTYDEAIFIISNYSGVSSTQPESLSITELLENNVDGFRFLIDRDINNKELIVKSSNNTYTPLNDVLGIIKLALDNYPSKILNLFLDFDFDPGILENEFRESGLSNYLYSHNIENDWPYLDSMINSNQRLVVFSMQFHAYSPSWIHYIWQFAIKPISLVSDEISNTTEVFDGDPHKQLLVYNGFNSPAIIEMRNELSSQTSQNPYFIEMLKSAWISNGKTPNFVMIDCFDNSIAVSLYRIREFRSISGTLTFNDELLKYVTWDGLNSLTGGKFSFVISPGEELILSPKSPGYKFKPESIKIDESTNYDDLYFKAIPLNITDDLEACYLFDNTAKDASNHKNNGKEINIEYIDDPDRSLVASFSESSLVRLAKAETLKMKDHDFTVSVWIKIQDYLPESLDQCILSSRTASYQSGLHFVIRNKRPYLGFFNDDLAGNTIIEEGKWYHIVWRYNKQSKEQSIFVNGKLDAISLKRPSYKGSDTLYVGAIYYPEATIKGEIDDLCIWSRALGEKEIASLNSQKFQIESLLDKIRLMRLFVYLLCFGALSIVVYLIFQWRKSLSKKRTETNEKTIINQDNIQNNPSQNYIQLFGEFTVTDKNGNNITALFSPKLKQLFLVLLVYSQNTSHGINTKDLSDILWKGQSIKDTKSLRGVTIRNLRLILEAINSIDIIYKSDIRSLKLSSDVKCDYIECLKLLSNKKLHESDHFMDFYNIIKAGELFMGESFYWLDETKGYIGNKIVDIVLNYLEANPDISDTEFANNLAEQVLIYDPINEVAISYKMKVLIKQNNHHQAKFTYECFCTMYKEMYGERYDKSFDELLK